MLTPGQILERRVGHPIANMSFAMMRGYIRSMQRRGIQTLHTARPFSHYRKIFYSDIREDKLLQDIKGKVIADVGCGYTPFADDSMFRKCYEAGIEFYAIDPMLGGDINIGVPERLLARSMGSAGAFTLEPPGFEKAIAASAEDLPFEAESIDEILCSYLLFVWITDQEALAKILGEFLRVLKPGGVARIYPLYAWKYTRFTNKKLLTVLSQFDIQQKFVHGKGDLRIQPSFLTTLTKY
ncbi:MAG: methyltransferase domain-containing protein [Pseudomonadota bacterium]